MKSATSKFQKGDYVGKRTGEAMIQKKFCFLSIVLFSGIGWGQVGDVARYPNPVLTPGETNSILTKELICSPSFRTGPYRHVPTSEKKEVFKRYAIPWSEHSKYEVDHFISLELGGSNAITNLWPEPYEPVPGARQKDVVEDYLHKEMCLDHLTLEEAQKKITNDWYEIYIDIKGGKP